MRRLFSLCLGLALAAALGACGSSSSGGPLEVTERTTIIDVRTPAEYAEGHLQGAINIDVQSESFVQQIATLPTDGDYIVYCRSGVRSAKAVALMKEAGFTNVRDGGSIDNAASGTKLPITTAIGAPA